MKKYKKIVRLIPLDQRRFKFLYIFSLLLIFCLFGRLVKLQVFNASDLQRKARLIQSSKTNALKKRREIVDRNNRLIAYDKTGKVLQKKSVNGIISYNKANYMGEIAKVKVVVYGEKQAIDVTFDLNIKPMDTLLPGIGLTQNFYSISGMGPVR